MKHKILLLFAKLSWKIELIENAIKYRKEIKELEWIRNKKKDLTLEMLGLQRLNQDSEEIRLIQAKLSILNEII